MDNIISEPTFYGGEIECVLDPISIDGIDKILDILDDYIELTEISSLDI